MIVQLASAFLGSLGFAPDSQDQRQTDSIRRHRGTGHLVYLFDGLCRAAERFYCQSDCGAVYVAIYAELMARVNKAPATIFLTAAAVPLIPGGRLYYTMFGLVSEDDAMFVENGTAAIIIALAISLGFVFVAVVNKYVNRFLYGKRQKNALLPKQKENTN